MLDTPRAPTRRPVPPAWSPLDLMPSGLRDDGTDMAPRIQGCIDRIAASTKKTGRIRIPEGIFYLAKSGSTVRALTVPQGVSVMLEGVTPHATLTVDGDYCAANMGPDDGTLTHGTPTAVTADIALTDSRITVASTAGLTVGGACELKSTVAFGSTSSTRNHVEGEVVRVKRIVSATQFDVDGRLMFAYLTVNSPTVTPLVLTEGCGIRDLSFRNLAYDGTGANNMAARFTGCMEPHAENIHMRDFDGAGLSFADCLDFVSRGVHGRDFNDNTALGYNGYMHRLYGACSGGTIINGTGRKGRHFVTTIGPDGGIAPRHIKTIGCHATEMSGAGFDNHAGARFMTFEDCSVEEGTFGFVVRSADTTIINPIVRNCGGGISVQGAYTTRQNFGHRCKVRGGVLENLNGNFHAVEVAGVNDFFMDGTFIKDVTGAYPGSGSHKQGIFIGKDETASSGGDNTSTNARVTNVTLRNVLTSEKAAIYVDSGTGHWFDNIDIDGAHYAIDGESDTAYGFGAVRARNLTSSIFGPFVATVAPRPAVFAADDLGAKGDGTTDDTVALQNGIDALAKVGGGTLRLRDGATYKITHTLAITTNNIRIVGNATIDASSIATATVFRSKFALTATGSIGLTRPLVQNVAVGDSTVHVSNSTWAAGDMILIRSTEPYLDGVTTPFLPTVKRGSLHRIESIVSAQTMTITEGSKFAYTAASGGTVAKVTPLTGIVIDGPTFILGGVGKGHCGIVMTYCDRPRIVNTTVRKAEDQCIAMVMCWAPVVEDSEVTDATIPSFIDTGYGVVADYATRDAIFRNVRARNCKHGVTGGAHLLPSFDCLVADCDIEGCSTGGEFASLDVHECCFGWEFRSNHITGGFHGINVRGPNTKCVGNTAENLDNTFIHVHSLDLGSTPGLYGCEIIDNVCDGAGNHGIWLEGSNECRVVDTVVRGNRLTRCFASSIRLEGCDDVELNNNKLATVTDSVGVDNGNNVFIAGTGTTDRCNRITINGGKHSRMLRSGLYAAYTDRLTLNGVTIENAVENGLKLLACTKTAVNGGRIEANGGANSCGVLATNQQILKLAGVLLVGGGGATNDAVRLATTGTGAGRITMTGCTADNWRRTVDVDTPGNVSIVIAVGNDVSACSNPFGALAGVANLITDDNIDGGSVVTVH